MQAEWRFPSNDHGEIKGINDSGVSMFKGEPLKSLAREICQNSLDAAIGGTVMVEFNLFKLPMDSFPGKEYLNDVFNRCLDFWSTQKTSDTKNFFLEAKRTLSKEYCMFLRISDFNTKGLTGSRELRTTDWTDLIKSSGSSDKKGTAGGSFGIGKFAPFACSSLGSVFYSTYDMYEEKAFQGVSRLVTFINDKDETTQGIGYYGNPEKNTPIYTELNLDRNFKRKEKEFEIMCMPSFQTCHVEFEGFGLSIIRPTY